jgi:hypothetical protein
MTGLILTLVNAVKFCPAATEKDKPSIQATEYEVKAAFLYNFIKFTDWPKDKVSEPNTITIGLLGNHDFHDAFDAVKGKKINDNKIMVKSFGKFSQFCTTNESGKTEFQKEIEELRKCHLIFICDSEQKYYKEFFEAINGWHVLTVGETEDFLDAGGIITFVPGTDKPVLEINQTTAKKEKIKISSRVLRLARKVIGAESSE